MILYAIGLSVITLVLSYLFWTWNYDYWKKRNVPGPKPVVVVGNFPKSTLFLEHPVYEIDVIYRKYQKEGAPFVGVFASRTPQLMIMDPEILKDIFIRKFNNFHDNAIHSIFSKQSEPLFGRNPFSLTGEEWKEKRAEIVPALKQSRIKVMFPLIEDCCKRLIEHITQTCEIDGRPAPIDIKTVAAKYTADVCASCIYSIDAKSFSKDPNEAVVYNMGTKTMKATRRIMFYFAISTVFPIIMSLYKLKYVPQYILDFYLGLMKDATTYRLKNNSDQQDYLGHLVQLKEKKNIQNVDMAAHAFTFFFDGFETAGLCLAMTLYELARNENAQQKLRNEVLSNVDENGEIPFDTLCDMPYLDAALSEGLRLYPLVSNSVKLCTTTTEFEGLKGHKLQVEKGTTILLPLFSIFRDPRHYDDPLTFNPDRFSAENGGVKKYEDEGKYFGFGNGPRICIGKNFAKAEIKHALAEIVKKFTFTVCETHKETEFDPYYFILQSRGSVNLNFFPIKM